MISTKKIEEKETEQIQSFSHAHTNKLTQLLGIRYPIIQAPIGAAATVELASAVSNSGGLGGTPLTWLDDERIVDRIRGIQSRTSNPFFVNYVLDQPCHSLELALIKGVKIIQFSWGIPSQKEVDLLQSYHVKLGIQVADQSGAQRALDLGADYLVCQGEEAGGHVQGSRPLSKALESVLTISGNVPVVASGGIATGTAMHRYISQGAHGVIMGSRFVATKESYAHERYKMLMVDASEDDTVLTVCMSKNWPNSLHRIVRNSTFNLWESAGNPPEGKRPGEEDLIAVDDHIEVKRYYANTPHAGYEGNIEAMALYAGKGVGEITDIPSVKELINRTWEEYISCSGKY